MTLSPNGMSRRKILSLAVVLIGSKFSLTAHATFARSRANTSEHPMHPKKGKDPFPETSTMASQYCEPSSSKALPLHFISISFSIMVAQSLSHNSNSPAPSNDLSALNKVLGQMSNPYAKYYSEDWPENPFHQGEIKLQQQANVQHLVMKYAPKVVRPYMPDMHREFYAAQPFLVAAARDYEGKLWSTLLMSPTGEADLLASPDPQTLVFGSQAVVSGDALEGALREGSDLGLLGIEFATKRRNRVNGRIASWSPQSFAFHSEQSFGNCPQYIKPRQWWTTTVPSKQAATSTSTAVTKKQRPSKLTAEQIKAVSEAETIFTASGYRGEGQDVRWGNDASHRGGPKGFVMVQDERTILLPEFAGNNHFNTLGNLQLDNRFGLTFPFFEEGGMLQLSGWAEVDMDTERAAHTYPGAIRLTTFHIEQVNVVPNGTLPLRWKEPAEAERRQLRVTSIVQESDNVKSFHFQPLPQDVQSLWDFRAGQHLPIQLRTKDGEILRTYSLSGAPGSQEYRISVKREPFGKASSFLHESVKVGDIIDANRPAGDFVLDTESDRTLVLISSGIGVTPMLSMLHNHVDEKKGKRKAIWIHGARNGKQHPFQGEVSDLKSEAAEGDVTTHARYSQPLPKDEGSYDSLGRINIELLESLIPDLQKADYYMCGNGAFMADVEEMLQLAEVDPHRVQSETF